MDEAGVAEAVVPPAAALRRARARAGPPRGRRAHASRGHRDDPGGRRDEGRLRGRGRRARPGRAVGPPRRSGRSRCRCSSRSTRRARRSPSCVFGAPRRASRSRGRPWPSIRRTRTASRRRATSWTGCSGCTGATCAPPTCSRTSPSSPTTDAATSVRRPARRHQAILAQWKQTSHSFALETLTRVDYDAYDPECIGATPPHGRLGRVPTQGVAMDARPRRVRVGGEHRRTGQDVGARACHGPGSGHVADPDDKAVFGRRGPQRGGRSGSPRRRRRARRATTPRTASRSRSRARTRTTSCRS